MYPKSLSHTPTCMNFQEKKHTVCRKREGETLTPPPKKTKNKIRKLPLYYFKSSRSFHTYHITFSHQTSVPPMHFASKQASIQNRETFSDSIIMYIPQQPIRSIQAQRPPKPYRASHAVEKPIPSTSIMPVSSPTQKQSRLYSTAQCITASDQSCNVRHVSCVL